METYKDREDLIIMFTDSYDVVLLAEPETILAEFYKMKANVVFGAEPFCWPDSSLKDSYPAIEAGKRFLNSGGFIGYAKDIYDVVTHHEIQNHEDDQLYYTKLYLDENFRKQHKFKLDHKSVIFQVRLFYNIKFSFSENATKIWSNLPQCFDITYSNVKTLRTIPPNVSGLFRKAEL